MFLKNAQEKPIAILGAGIVATEGKHACQFGRSNRLQHIYRRSKSWAALLSLSKLSTHDRKVALSAWPMLWFAT